jgi:hypothetical protein
MDRKRWHDSHTPEITEVNQYEVVPVPKKFWTLSTQPNRYLIMDGAKSIGEIGDNKVTVFDSEFNARYATVIGYRSGPLFAHIAVRERDAAMPFFFCDRQPLCLPDEGINFSFFSPIEGCKLVFGEGVFRILDASGGGVGAFVGSPLCDCDHDKSNGCIRLRAGLPAEVHIQLLAALAVVGTAHTRGMFDSSGF